MPTQSLSINELKDAFFSLKTNKSPGVDEIDFNVIKHCFGELCGPLKYLFESSLQSGVFPDLMKIAIVSPVFKTGDSVDISNYHPFLFFLVSQKSLNAYRLYKYLTDQKILHPQQFGFRKGHSTEHQLVDQIYESFEKDNYTVGIFVDFSKCLIQSIIRRASRIFRLQGSKLQNRGKSI